MLRDDRISSSWSRPSRKVSTLLVDKVGLQLSPETIPNHLLFEAGNGTTLGIRPAQRQSGRPHPGTLLEHRHRRGCKELAGRGVVFRDYGHPTFKTVDHVATTPIGAAWFKDPDGNTIAVFQRPRAEALSRPTRSLAGPPRRDTGRSRERIRVRRVATPSRRPTSATTTLMWLALACVRYDDVPMESSGRPRPRDARRVRAHHRALSASSAGIEAAEERRVGRVAPRPAASTPTDT